jgi:mersacidin/lichenicidin family type 2 lantibiotic
MKKKAIRAWRDADYYLSLSDAERKALPENPAALLEVDDDVLGNVAGGCSFWQTCPTSAICTPCPPLVCQ